MSDLYICTAVFCEIKGKNRLSAPILDEFLRVYFKNILCTFIDTPFVVYISLTLFAVFVWFNFYADFIDILVIIAEFFSLIILQR